VTFTTGPETKHAGESGTFNFSAADVVPSSGVYSGIDHFAYSFGSAADLAGDGGTHVTPTLAGPDATATITATPTTWGSAHLYVVAVDKAGNRTPVTTYDFYVAG